LTLTGGIAPALGLRAGTDGPVMASRTVPAWEIHTMAVLFSRTTWGRRPVGLRCNTTRLELERLEDRSLPSGYQQLNLVGYQPGMARHTDPNLNGWGMDYAPNGPFCVANTIPGVATFYDSSGHVLPLVVTIPAAPGHPLGPVGRPKGVVYNPTSDFVISEGGRSAAAVFLFDSGDGTISVFDPATGAYLGQLRHPDGTPIAIPGLWDLVFGGGSKINGKTNQLFFDAGPNAPNPAGNGLFGMIFPAGREDQAHGDDLAGNAAVSVDPFTPLVIGQTNASAPGEAVLGGPENEAAASAAPGPMLQDGALARSQWTIVAPSQRAVAFAPTRAGSDQPIQPASASAWLSAGANHRVLDHVFADLDGSMFADTLRADDVPDWAVWAHDGLEAVFIDH
jgi:hypothetical protein